MDREKDVILGGFPDIFTCNSGEKLTDPSQWPQRREELLEAIVPLLYGGLPPKPEVLRVEKPYPLRGRYTYCIKTGTKDKTMSFDLTLYAPEGEGPFPVLLTGDECFGNCTEAVIREANQRGYLVAVFNRLNFALDNYEEADYTGGVYDVYPEMRFGAIAAWAWGYHRCVDALEQIPIADSSCVAISGHSRGGKTVLLAAATDERILFTQDNGSGACGGACFRYIQYPTEEQVTKFGVTDPRSEPLDYLGGIVPYWLGPDIWSYCGKEETLPFDQHFLKAAIAPRYLLATNSLDDLWCNPKGSYQTYLAAKELYRFLGVEERIDSVYRYGPHAHTYREFCLFLDFMDAARNGRPFLSGNADKAIQMPFVFGKENEK